MMKILNILHVKPKIMGKIIAIFMLIYLYLLVKEIPVLLVDYILIIRKKKIIIEFVLMTKI